MHIPTHQIHNVLNAYAKRLKKKHDAAKGPVDKEPENQVNAYSVEGKRHRIINKISADIIERIARSKPQPRPKDPETSSGEQQLSHQKQSQSGTQPELIRYHILSKTGEKVSAKIKIQNSDFLIKQLEEIARNASEDEDQAQRAGLSI